MSQNLGDKAINDTIYFGFNTHKADGTPITLASTPTLYIYKDDSTSTEVTTGVTLNTDFDSLVGYHQVTVVCTDAFYASGHNYRAVLKAGTVDSIAVAGTEVAHWTIEKNAALRPTTAGRTLDVASTGEAGLDFDNIHDASGAHTLTNITVPTVTTTTTATTATSVTNAVTITANQAVNVAQWGGSNIATPAVTGEPVVTLGATQAAYAPMVAGTAVKISVGTDTGQINLSSGKVPATIAAGDLATDSITAAALKTDAVTEIVNGILDQGLSTHLTTDTVGGNLASLSGKKTVVSNQEICYAADNLTELFRFNLTDNSGTPTMTNVYTRTKV